MNELYIITGGSGTIGRNYIDYISQTNKEILNIDLIKNPKSKYNIVQDLNDQKTLLVVHNFLKEYKKLKIIKFIHLAGIVGESLKNDWVTDIDSLGFRQSELCYTISVTMPAKLISIFTKFKYTRAIYINSIYGTKLPDFKLYKNNRNLQNPMSYGSIKSAQLYSMKWLNEYFQDKLRLNSVSPGGIESKNMNHEFKTKYKNKTLGGKFSSFEDVIFTSEYLLSNQANSIFNQNIFVDYGFR